MNKFQDVFTEHLQGTHPEREIYFGVHLDPIIKPVFVPPYKIAPNELTDLKLMLKDPLVKVFM